MAIKLLELAHGDTFQYIATWPGSEINEMKSQVRDSSNRLISEVIITSMGLDGKYRFMVLDTSKWPIGTLYTDIQRTTNGVIESTQLMTISVVRSVTL